jgi:fumarylacetoacetate (FAA) hydrolase family protein
VNDRVNDWMTGATLIGRVWLPDAGGPALVTVRDGGV